MNLPLPSLATRLVGIVLAALGYLLSVPGPGRAEVVESESTFESGGKTIAVERFEPKASGRYPAIVVLHGAGGMQIGGPAFRMFARRLAREGYVAHVVHYFDRTGTTRASETSMRENFSAWMKTIADGVGNVAKQENVDPKRIGLLGFSLGAYLSLSLATLDPRISAVVEYFGGLPEALAKDLKRMPPVLVLHGDADPIVPIKEARDLERLLKEKAIPHEVRIYPGQGHGFLGKDGIDAANRALRFFDNHVKG